MPKARWHDATVMVDDLDPFGEQDVNVTEVGTPIDLSGPEPQLNRKLVDLVQREGELLDQGKSCSIKDVRGASCFCCPLFGSQGELCTVSRAQQEIVTLLAIRRHGG